MTESLFKQEVEAGKRFEFGKNWGHFLETLDAKKIEHAKSGLLGMLDRSTLQNVTFLDAGSGSGLSSLVARQSGAKVTSFDFDPQSVACTQQLREQHYPHDNDWTVQPGSVLDKTFLTSLNQFDIVYSWGVLHHTGSMWEAIGNVSENVKPGGLLFIMIYADEGWKSEVWTRIKKFYCSGTVQRWLTLGLFIPYYLLRGLVEDVMALKNPVARYRSYAKTSRGMSKYHDWIDWLGGFPFETANVDTIEPFLNKRGFELVKQNGQQFVFKKQADA